MSKNENKESISKEMFRCAMGIGKEAIKYDEDGNYKMAVINYVEAANILTKYFE